MKILLTVIVLFGIFAPNNTFYSQKNRISLQAGLFHHFFDETPLFNNEKVSNTTHWRFPLYYFGGQFNDSWGIQFQRIINPNSSLSCEYMLYSAVYQPIFTNWVNTGPRIHSKRLHKVNITYSRKLTLNKKWKFNYGVGVNSQWGTEKYFLFSGQHSAGFFEPHFQNRYRKDFGLNLRTGIEYSPIEQLTLFTFIDFLGTVFISYKSDGTEDSYPVFYEEYSDEIRASLLDLSLNFGIGYNFSWGPLFKRKK
jgi:hypothetical protein